MKPRPVEEFLALPVCVRGIELGHSVDLLVDRELSRALGFDVLCGDQAHRFLPFVVTKVADGAIEIESPLVLLDFGQVAFYREQATTVRELDGDSATFLVGPDGSIESVSLR